MPRLLLAFLLATLAACRACPPDVERWGASKCKGEPEGKYVDLRWEPGQQMSVFEGPGGSLTVEVRRVLAQQIKNEVEVELWFTSSYPVELRFEKNRVHLAWDGHELPVLRTSDPNPDVPPNKPLRKTFTFAVDPQGRAGVHDFVIDELRFFRDGRHAEVVGGPIVVPIKVGGRRGAQDDWDRDEPAPAAQPSRDGDEWVDWQDDR